MTYEAIKSQLTEAAQRSTKLTPASAKQIDYLAILFDRASQKSRLSQGNVDFALSQLAKNPLGLTSKAASNYIDSAKAW